MKDILEEIVSWKQKEISEMKERLSEHDIHTLVEHLHDRKTPSMSAALLNSSSGIIAEFKRKSPSKGWIKEYGKAENIPLSYQKNGATALSILTDAHFFGGEDHFITKAIDSGVTLPILYKNFIIDEYQLFQARLCGASAVLLIAACLSKAQYNGLNAIAHELKMETFLEVHSEQEIEYADVLPDMCGVNNRHLGTFKTDVNTSFRLALRLPSDCIKVSESGISNSSIVKELRDSGYKGFLIGENFMKEDNPGVALLAFLESLKVAQ